AVAAAAGTSDPVELAALGASGEAEHGGAEEGEAETGEERCAHDHDPYPSRAPEATPRLDCDVADTPRCLTGRSAPRAGHRRQGEEAADVGGGVGLVHRDAPDVEAPGWGDGGGGARVRGEADLVAGRRERALDVRPVPDGKAGGVGDGGDGAPQPLLQI